jgi:hypothetical protein
MNNQSIFLTSNSISEMARFIGFSGTQFRGVYSYASPVALRWALNRRMTFIHSSAVGSGAFI